MNVADGRPRTVVFMYDQMGQVIKRDESDNISGAGDPHEVWYRFSGRQIGYVGNNPPPLKLRRAKLGQAG